MNESGRARAARREADVPLDDLGEPFGDQRAQPLRQHRAEARALEQRQRRARGGEIAVFRAEPRAGALRGEQRRGPARRLAEREPQRAGVPRGHAEAPGAQPLAALAGAPHQRDLERLVAARDLARERQRRVVGGAQPERPHAERRAQLELGAGQIQDHLRAGHVVAVERDRHRSQRRSGDARRDAARRTPRRAGGAHDAHRNIVERAQRVHAVALPCGDDPARDGDGDRDVHELTGTARGTAAAVLGGGSYTGRAASLRARATLESCATVASTIHRYL